MRNSSLPDFTAEEFWPLNSPEFNCHTWGKCKSINTIVAHLRISVSHCFVLVIIIIIIIIIRPILLLPCKTEGDSGTQGNAASDSSLTLSDKQLNCRKK